MPCPRSNNRLGKSAAACGLAVLMARPALAEPSPDAEGSTIVVTAQRPAEQETATSYKISRSTSATRTDTALIDVPQSVNVVSLKQILDQSANNITDVVRYIPGVFASQGEGNRETLTFRGNSTTSSFFVDGVRDDVQTYRDLYNIDRLEVLRGSSALAFGRGTTGGLINRVTKVADGERHAGLRLEGGSYDHYRGQFDLGAPVDANLSVRMTGAYQNSRSYRERVFLERGGINPTATLKLDPATTITLGYEHFDDRRVGDRGVSSYLGVPLETPPRQFFGDPDASPTYTHTDAGTLLVAHAFSKAVTMRNHLRYAEYDKFYQNVFPGAVNTTTQKNPDGLATGSYSPGTIVALSAYNNRARRKNFYNQTDLNAAVTTGSIEHVLLVGAEFGRQSTDNLRNEGFFPTATAPQGVPTIFTPIAAPRVRRRDVVWREAATSGDTYSVATVAAGYIQDQLRLSPAFQIIAGIRYERFNTKVTNRNPFVAAGIQRDFDVTDSLWSPRAGLIYKPVEQASIYASFSRSYLPRGGDQLAGLTIANQSLAPERYDTYEVGAKWDIVPTLNMAGAVFQLDRSNVLVLSDPNNPASLTVPVGHQRTRGVEVSAQGEITDRLSLTGSYTYSDAKFLDSLSGTVRAGNRVPNVPRNAATLWARYNPTRSFGAALGVIYQGQRFAATDNAVVLPGYTRVDGAIFYTINRRLDVQINVENIFDRRYFLYSDNNTNITPGSPTAVRIGLNARF